jgi:hypothetical protein
MDVRICGKDSIVMPAGSPSAAVITDVGQKSICREASFRLGSFARNENTFGNVCFMGG